MENHPCYSITSHIIKELLQSGMVDINELEKTFNDKEKLYDVIEILCETQSCLKIITPEGNYLTLGDTFPVFLNSTINDIIPEMQRLTEETENKIKQLHQLYFSIRLLQVQPIKQNFAN